MPTTYPCNHNQELINDEINMYPIPKREFYKVYPYLENTHENDILKKID